MEVPGIIWQQIIGLPINAIAGFITNIAKQGYDNEKFADNFATSYGYGNEIASALMKMDNVSSVGQKTFKNPVSEFAVAIGRMTSAIWDVHPSTCVRVRDQVKKLAFEMNDSSYDPKVKQMLQDDYNRLSKLLIYYESADRDRETKNYLKGAQMAFAHGKDTLLDRDANKRYDSSMMVR